MDNSIILMVVFVLALSGALVSLVTDLLADYLLARRNRRGDK